MTMPFADPQELIAALLSGEDPQLVGDVMPLPINPGPMAGRPTLAETRSSQGMPYVGPPQGLGGIEILQRLLNADKGPFGPRGR